jgi:glycosyltransferase involved in cell wall biosynthesis
LYGQVPFLVAFQFFSLWALARREKPDLLYAHWFTPQAITVAFVSMLTKTPFVFTTHASDVSILARLPFANKLVQLVCGQAEAYSAVSERTAKKLQMFFSEQEWIDRYSKKLEIIPMGIELNSLSTTRTVKQQIASRYSPDNRQVVLFLGRLAEKKGVTYLLDAISLLPDTILINLQVLIAGDGPLREKLERKAKTLRLSNVTFTGYVLGQEKEDILSLARYVCIPSIIDSSGDSEGLPVVLMEGLAAGKVILASKVSGAEQFLRHGETGFLFDQKSSETLRDAISDALSLSESEIEEISMKSRELAKQFGWEDITKRYYRLLKGAIANEV